MRIRHRGFDVWIVAAIHWAERPFSPDPAREFFPGFLRRWLFDRISAAAQQDRARDAKGGGEGFQALRILKEVISDK
jgi:hypothetical protein